MAPGRPSGTVRRVGVGIKHRGYKRGSRLTISLLCLSLSLPSRTDELPPKGRENRRDVESGLSILNDIWRKCARGAALMCDL